MLLRFSTPIGKRRWCGNDYYGLELSRPSFFLPSSDLLSLRTTEPFCSSPKKLKLRRLELTLTGVICWRSKGSTWLSVTKTWLPSFCYEYWKEISLSGALSLLSKLSFPSLAGSNIGETHLNRLSYRCSLAACERSELWSYYIVSSILTNGLNFIENYTIVLWPSMFE